jgi:hypothetical protein
MFELFVFDLGSTLDVILIGDLGSAKNIGFRVRLVFFHVQGHQLSLSWVSGILSNEVFMVVSAGFLLQELGARELRTSDLCRRLQQPTPGRR